MPKHLLINRFARKQANVKCHVEILQDMLLAAAGSLLYAILFVRLGSTANSMSKTVPNASKQLADLDRQAHH